MNKAQTVVRNLLRRGVMVWTEKGVVRCRAPRGAINQGDLEELSSWKSDIVSFLDTAAITTPDLSMVETMRRAHALPLSFAQERLWFLDQMSSTGSAYNFVFGLELEGPLDTSALERALIEIVHRHESLRTRFELACEDPIQAIDGPELFKLQHVDISDFADGHKTEQVLQLTQSEIDRPFDLCAGPVFRANLVRLSTQSHVLLAAAHHIAIDGSSMGLFRQELCALYAAFCRGQDSPLAPLTYHYADYAVWQRQWLQGDILDRQIAFWKETLSGAPALLDLPTDRVRPTTPSYRGRTTPFELSKELSDALQSLGRRESASLFMVLLAVFDVLLWRLSGQTEIVVGTPTAGRTTQQIEQLIGFFVNTLPMHVKVWRYDVSCGCI
jgi:hypothetical protein